MLSMGAVFLIEYLDDTLKTPDDVKALGMTTLGAVARSPDGKAAGILVTNQVGHSSIAEAYRMLRTNIQFSDVDQRIASLLITSPGSTEGKSTTVANLGIVMAQAGQRVIVVDSDLRRPVLHKLLELPNDRGLTNMLVEGAATTDGWLQETGVENLRAVTSGPLPPNPSELLGSARMRELVARLEAEADLVLFDSPPVMAVTDAAVLAQEVDGTLLVVDCGDTRRKGTEQALGTLNQVGANVLGLVLNKVDLTWGGYYYYYYYSGYHSDNGRGPGRGRRRREQELRGVLKRATGKGEDQTASTPGRLEGER
jgi:capsular exopolysaccharide synthesis family protein